MSLTEILFWITFIGGTIGALFNPVCGVLLYVLIYNLNPETQWWGHNVAQLGLRTSFTSALATALGALLNWRPMERGMSQFPWMLRAAVLFLLYGALISISGLYPLGTTLSQHYLIKLSKVLIFIVLLVRIVRSLDYFRWLLWAWMAGTIYVGYEAWSGVGTSTAGRILAAGLGGPDFGETSGLGAHLTAMIAIAGFLFYSSRSYRGKFFALLAAAFAVNTVIMTRTRNAFPGILVLIIFGILRVPKGLRVKCAVGVIVGLGLSLNLTDQAWWQRMETMKNPQADESIVMRFEYWRAAVDMVRDYPFGVGPGHYRHMVKNYIETLTTGRSAHSTYFQCLAELGYPGTLLFLAVVFLAFAHYERARSLGKHWQRFISSDPGLSADMRELLLMATANQVALAGYLTCSAFTTRLWTEGVWLILGMSCCVHNITRGLARRARESETEPVPALAGAELNPVI